jgi:hypothetical protein
LPPPPHPNLSRPPVRPINPHDFGRPPGADSNQFSRELLALQQEFDYLEGKYLQAQRTLNRLSNGAGGNNESAQLNCNNGGRSQQQQQQQQQIGPTTTQRQQQDLVAATNTSDNKQQQQQRHDGRQSVTANELRQTRPGLDDEQSDAGDGPPARRPAEPADNNQELACMVPAPSELAVSSLAAPGCHRPLTAGSFRELEDEICLIGVAGDERGAGLSLGLAGAADGPPAQSMEANHDDRQPAINADEPASWGASLAYAFEGAPGGGGGPLPKQRHDNNLAKLLGGHRGSVAAGPDNGRCTSSLSLSDHTQVSQQQLQNNYGHHLGGRLSGGDLSAVAAAGRLYAGGALSGDHFLAQGLNESFCATLVGQPVAGAVSQSQTIIGMRRSSSIRRRLPQPNVSNNLNQQQQQQQRDRPSSALLPGSEPSWPTAVTGLHQHAHPHRASSGSFDAANHQQQQQQQQQQQRRQTQSNRNELLLLARRQSPAGCQLEQTAGGAGGPIRIPGDDDDGMPARDDDATLVTDRANTKAAAIATLESDAGLQATFNRFQQPRHSADSASVNRPSGMCSATHHHSGPNASIREQQAGAPTTVSLIHRQHRMSVCDGRVMDKPLVGGQFYQSIDNNDNNNGNNNNNDGGALEQRHEFLPHGAFLGGAGGGFPDESTLARDHNEDPRDRLNSKCVFADQAISIERTIQAQQHRQQQQQQQPHPFETNHSFCQPDSRKQHPDSLGGPNALADNEHQNDNEFVALPLDCMALEQQQQLSMHREHTPDGARLADFHSVLLNERYTMQGPMELHGKLNSSHKLRPKRNGTDDDDSPPPPPAMNENQLMSAIGMAADVNSFGDKSNLKHKPRAMERERQYGPAPHRTHSPNPAAAQVNDSNWLPTANQSLFRRL